jgi:uncharacterized protein YcgI (DUF1989 family)
VTAAESCSVVTAAPSVGLRCLAGGGLLVAASAAKALAGEELVIVSLEGEAVVFFFLFSGATGTKGSDRPTS